MSIELTPLPFSSDDLAPYISKKTLDLHYGKHHKHYVDTLNHLIAGTRYDTMNLEEVMQKSIDGLDEKEIFNNAAQAWNHTFFWNCLTPDSAGRPDNKTSRQLSEEFGSFNDFKSIFTETAEAVFGSGWVWLVKNPEGMLSIEATKNAGNPLIKNHSPILVCDVWEHAYYLDYQNDRSKFLTQFWKIINWDFVSQNLQESSAQNRTQKQSSMSMYL
jgi:Fe-Mn family superoxide dismutase